MKLYTVRRPAVGVSSKSKHNYRITQKKMKEEEKGNIHLNVWRCLSLASACLKVHITTEQLVEQNYLPVVDNSPLEIV